MEKIRNFLLNCICFFLFAGAIYRMAMYTPPPQGTNDYMCYSILAVLAASILAGLLVCICNLD